MFSVKEQETISAQSIKKIEQFGINFVPNQLPFDVVRNPYSRIVCGTSINANQLRLDFLRQYGVPPQDVMQIMQTVNQLSGAHNAMQVHHAHMQQ